MRRSSPAFRLGRRSSNRRPRRSLPPSIERLAPMLSFKDALRQMWRDLRGQKLRTTLTVFGIVWGTVAVTLLLAFGKGMQKQMTINAAGLGDQICIGWPGLTSIPFQGLGKGRKIRVNEEDVEAIRGQAVGI